MSVRFRADSRGVSEVVGAVLLLGILMLSLSIYQASIVPNQNAATEFEHNQQVEDEMVDVRNAILEARSTGEDAFAGVTLGTRYQSRLLTVNPPPPAGTLQTVKQRNVSVTEEGGEMRADPLELADRPLENQFIEYTPQYYEYDQAGTIRYENTVVYHEFAETNVFLSDQTLLQGDTVSLIPLEGEFSRNGRGRVTVEPTPGVLETVEVEDPNVTVPTNLSQNNWEALLGDELEPADSLTVSDGNLTLELDGTYDVAYAPVGVNRVPAEGERSAGGIDINPAAPGDVQLIGATWRNGDNAVELTFKNSAENSSFTDGRINFYTGGGDDPDEVENVNVVGGSDNPRGTGWAIGDDFKDLDPNVFLQGDGATTTIELEFDKGVQESNDFFIVTLTLESGQQATYFVGEGFSFDGGSGGGGDIPGGEDITGNPGTAFDDANDNGALDAGETTYTDSQLYTFNDNTVNLVIPDAVGNLQRNNDPISITAKSITTEVDINANPGVTLTATEGEVRARTTVRSQNGNVVIDGKRVDVTDGTIRSQSQDVTISATQDGGGEIVATDAVIRSDNNDVALSSVGDMFLDGADVRANNDITADLGGSNTLHIDGTSISNQNGPGYIQYTPGSVTEDPESTIAAPQ